MSVWGWRSLVDFGGYGVDGSDDPRRETETARGRVAGAGLGACYQPTPVEVKAGFDTIAL